MRLAVRQRNERGGVGDRYLVELVALNDFNEPSEATLQAREAEDLARARYRTGVESLVTLLEAQRRSVTNQSRWLAARRGLLDNRIDLLRFQTQELDALAIAEREPERDVVFLAVGFETTAPANAVAVHQAHVSGFENFSVVGYDVVVNKPRVAAYRAPGAPISGFAVESVVDMLAAEWAAPSMLCSMAIPA